MFLQPSEVGFLKHLKEARVPLVEFDFPAKRIYNIQSQLEKLIGQNYYLNRSAKDGYRSYLQAYASHSLRSVFDVHKLDLVKGTSGARLKWMEHILTPIYSRKELWFPDASTC